MKAVVGAFNQEKALVGAFSVIVQPVVEPMEHYTALVGAISNYRAREHKQSNLVILITDLLLATIDYTQSEDRSCITAA